MITKTYKIAGMTIGITSLHEAVHEYCSGYESDETAELSVRTDQSDIDNEKKKTDSEYAFEGLHLPSFSQGTLEITAVYRKIAEMIPYRDMFVFHGSVVAVDSQAYLFTAKSGTGKSTHTRLWRELLGDKAVMVNDDKPILRITDGEVLVYGTPYNGKHRLGNNICVPLKAVCILERAEDNTIVPINKSDAYAMLLQQVYRPADKAAFVKTLTLIDQLTEKTKLYKLGANMDISAAETAYNAMKG